MTRQEKIKAAWRERVLLRERSEVFLTLLGGSELVECIDCGREFMSGEAEFVYSRVTGRLNGPYCGCFRRIEL